MKAILIWLKEWSWLDKRNLCYLIYMEESENTMNNLAEKDNNLKRDASNFFKAVFGIPAVMTTKTWSII